MRPLLIGLLALGVGCEYMPWHRSLAPYPIKAEASDAGWVWGGNAPFLKATITNFKAEMVRQAAPKGETTSLTSDFLCLADVRFVVFDQDRVSLFKPQAGYPVKIKFQAVSSSGMVFADSTQEEFWTGGDSTIRVTTRLRGIPDNEANMVDHIGISFTR